MPDSISLRTEDRILNIRLQRAQKRNALDRSMYRQLTAALQQAADDDAVRVVVISGDQRSFCSGNDISDFIAAGEDLEALRPALAFLQRLVSFSKPLVAAVSGTAIGIGATLLLHCDLVYAADSAEFQLPFVNLGLVPEGGSSQLLPAMLGHQRAAELLLLGERFDADRAQQLGLVNAVVSAGALDDHVRRQALKLAAKPPAVMAATKALMKSQQQRPLAEVLETEARLFAECLQSPEAREALAAFQQRQKADFSTF